ncbi:hypothetical protein Rhe02_11800 [Rhizocola hellebori]|uniref:Uncharacterized protein n=1 Tax=Rhizocola hellebori TaxID=1392758 RepID=A0A8J3Q4D3_9ACTN|nr:hypothetical protein [Rhizocola hellebori]GIH03113.1 hypothetical protein Rhe02_11800 [Rhizocola hellebori]
MAHRVVLLLDGPAGEQRVELVRGEPCLAAAVVCGVRDVERSGARVRQLAAAPQSAVLAAADLVLRLRQLVPELAEQEVAMLLELLEV